MTLLNTLYHLLNHPLNRSQKGRTLFQFMKWQIGSRLVPGEVIYHWVNGSKMLARPGEVGVTGNIYCGLLEFSDMAFLLHSLRQDDLFVDVGANVGAYTVLASAAVGARSACFEPVPSTYARLTSNIRLNAIDDRVIAANIALGSDKGTLMFSSAQDSMNHVLAHGEVQYDAISVNVSTLDSELQGSPFLMKMDVEGYETPALKGARATLQDPNLCGVIIELNGAGLRYGFDEQDILRTMADYGFFTYSYDPFARELVGLDGKNRGEGNTLFIRNPDRVLERVKSAPIVHVHGASI